MSKLKGNFLTVSDLIENYGCDASRITFADCGDTLDDANFLREINNLSVNRLHSFENLVKILVNEVWSKVPDLKINDPDGEIKLDGLFDKIFDNNINYLITQTKKSYDEMKYKNVLKYAFYEMINIYYLMQMIILIKSYFNDKIFKNIFHYDKSNNSSFYFFH